MTVACNEILKAIEEFDTKGRDEFFRYFEFSSHKRAKRYFIRQEGQDYDMLPIVRVAYGEIRKVPQDSIGKPSKVARWLKALGFEIVHLGDEGALESQEGRKYWALQERAERDSSLAREAKCRNAKKNGGCIKCDACGFRDKEPGMFDAHHLKPLEHGERKSRVEDFAVLCPTCHRWAHTKADNRRCPLPVEEVRRAREKLAHVVE